MLQSVATSKCARKNRLVYFRFGNDRDLLKILNQALEFTRLRRFAQVFEQINSARQHGPYFTKDPDCLMGAFG